MGSSCGTSPPPGKNRASSGSSHRGPPHRDLKQACPHQKVATSGQEKSSSNGFTYLASCHPEKQAPAKDNILLATMLTITPKHHLVLPHS